MSRNKKLWIILDLVVIVAFNILFFMISGFDHEAAVWWAYIFIHIAYAAIWVSPMLVERGRAENATDMPIYAISSVYFIVSFVIDLVLIIAKAESVKLVFGINIVLIAVYACLLISNMLANSKTESDMRRQSMESFFVKNSAGSLKAIMGQADDSVKGSIERLYDKMSASQTKTCPEVAGVEHDIADMIIQLREAVSSNDTDRINHIINGLGSKIDERNSRLRIIG